jgi:L-ascorbate metabolism protein UlaG (beta-lactamase superfamily)
MSDEQVFLRPNVIVEPLVDNFFAWLHTVAPVQAAMNLAYLHVPLLESYVQSPPVHVAASVNPELRGGFFVNVPERRVGEVRELLERIKAERKEMLAFAEGVKSGFDLLHQTAAGFDLTSFYGSLPEPLAGTVEVAYDTSNQPLLRFMEPLLYETPVYAEERQSLQLSIETGVERPFTLSTPRLPSPDHLDLPLPFRHAGVEHLFRSRLTPTTPAALREQLEIADDAAAAKLATLLTGAPTLPSDRHVDAGARLRYFGHACLVMQTPDAAVITDPFISADVDAGGRYTYCDLPDHIDVCLITHGHQDHVVLETLLQLRGRVGVVVVPRGSRGNLCDPSLGLYLRHLGFPVVEVDDFEEVPFPGGRVVATPFLGEHSDLDVRAKSTYWVELAGKMIFVGADSSGIDPVLYRHMRRHLGEVDMAFLGMECDGAPLTWLYQALLTQPVTKKMSDSRKLSGSNAAQAGAIMQELGAAEAYVYAMGEESWLGHVMATTYNEDAYQLRQAEEFAIWCADHGIKTEHLLEQREWRW